MDSVEIEKILESVLEEETEQIKLSQDTPLPCKILWIVSNGSYVTKEQIIAILTPCKSANETEYTESGEICSEGLKVAESAIAEHQRRGVNNNLILKSYINGKLVRMAENLSILTSLDQVLGKIEVSTCPHDIVVHGLCANCSLQVESGLKRKLDDLSLLQNKLVPGFITNHSGFEINSKLAYDMECNEISKYLEDRKLCLVLDLDNTLVHATSQKAPIDMDIEMIEVSGDEWENSINFVQYAPEDDEEAVKLQQRLESCILKTIVYNEAETTCCYSYFKLRPGIFHFFREVTKNYKLFLFTMGTRQHAHSALQILDPKGLYFGNRVFCRNDSTSSMKSLDRIFPRHKNLVLVLDDSEYVWTNNLGLIKVHPYYFFSDLTYLNNYDLNNLTKSSAALQSICNYSNFIWSKLIHTSNYHTGTPGEETVTKTDNKLDKDGFPVPTIPKRCQFRYNGYLICNERPSDIYLPLPKPLEQKNGLFKKIHIKDNDMQLYKLIKVLENIHSKYFEKYDQIVTELSSITIPAKSSPQNSNPPSTHENSDKETSPSECSETSGTEQFSPEGNSNDCSDEVTPSESKTDSSSNSAGNSETSTSGTVDVRYLLEKGLLPIACMILKEVRESVLRDVILYSNTSEFINLNPYNRQSSELDDKGYEDINFLLCSDFGKWAIKFGARITNTMQNMTHVIVNNRNSIILEDTSIKKVHIKWLEAVIYSFEHVDEEKFNPDNWRVPFRSFWDVLNS